MGKNITIATLSLMTFGFSAFAAVKSSPPSSSATTYQNCVKYTLGMDSFGTTNPKDIASNFLNGALDQLELLDPPSQAEVQKRETCVLLSLQHGADANNTKYYTAPLLMAISDKDVNDVQALLQYKANPNVKDSAMTGSSKISALQRACEGGNEDIAIALINAGADPTFNAPLWAAASSAESKVVAAMLKTGKVPVNQLTVFSEIGDDSETALDASDSRVAALNQYFTQFTASSSISDKLDAANEILYANYVELPMLKTGTDPDAYLKNLLQKQTQVSSLLKSAGWSCHKPHCGVDLPDDDGSAGE